MPAGKHDDWEMDGFAAPPKEYTSTGTDKIMRCYSQSFQDAAGNWHGSRQYGNCFWVVRSGVDDGPITNQTLNCELLTVDVLEANLNAALWNNTYQRIGVFQIRTGLRYRIGPIGQNTRGTQKGVIFAEPGSPRGQLALSPPEDLTHVASYDYTRQEKTLLQVVLATPGQSKDVSKLIASMLTLVAEYPIRGRERYMGGRSTHPRN